MTAIELWLLATGLAMDCFAVAIAGGICLKKPVWRIILTTAFCFGFFQGMMPFIGWSGTRHFGHLIESCDHWIAFFLLTFSGGKMLYESFKKDEEKHYNLNSLCVILALSAATSIDALAAGISFACTGYHDLSDILYPVAVTGLVSFFFTWIGLMIGIFAVKRFNLPVEGAGGIMLILIGCKLLYTHLAGA